VVPASRDRVGHIAGFKSNFPVCYIGHPLLLA
jgi:hypothetical protein